MSQGDFTQSGLTSNDSLRVFQPVSVPETRKQFERVWTQLFGTLTSDKLAVGVVVDFVAANFVLVLAAVVRLAVIGGLSWSNPIGTLFDKVNATYLMNAGWFGLSTVVLFALAGVYKPVPFSRVKQRLSAIALACVIGEDSPLNPVSLYATTKIDAERALLDTADADFQPTILRFATAYGWSHRPRFDLVANLFSAQAVTDKKIRVFNGEQWRPFVHTRDIARACVLALEAPLAKVGCQIFNVGDEGQNYTLTQLGQIVSQSCPGIEVEEVRNNDDLRNYRVNFSKIRRTLGFRASIDLIDGVQEMVDAVLGGHVSNWREPIYSNSKHLEGEGLSVLKFDAHRNDVDDMPATTRFLAKKAAA